MSVSVRKDSQPTAEFTLRAAHWRAGCTEALCCHRQTPNKRSIRVADGDTRAAEADAAIRVRRRGDGGPTSTIHEASMTLLAGVGGSSGTPGVGARSSAVAPFAASPVGCSPM